MEEALNTLQVAETQGKLMIAQGRLPPPATGPLLPLLQVIPTDCPINARHFYIIYKGVQVGIFTDWREANARVKGVPFQVFQGYDSYEEVLSEFIEAKQLGATSVKNHTTLRLFLFFLLSRHSSRISDPSIYG
ncbi:hypothetical protein JAAARDRAFT_187411 [Jaapia argillacea MUCL 33604]|uniref:Ribonuclease H1 N-terminal domain-containing protein n=1 Tax=Jaapia argillacea MUCL 33604 TaxID=933084 RepID=A0A067QAE4_9AGAM|nr:hypothetical protein JAAARDRAFT_187411 [Jaapia argillacea MUCL 33604]